MDYMLGLPSTKWGNNYVFVVVDLFSNMSILVACKKSIKIEAIAKLFFERVWVHFGIPQTFVSDLDKRLLHIKNTHFDSVASVVITKVTSVTFCSQGHKCRMLLTSVASIKEIMLP
jgi:hypothetical protein